MSQVPCLHEHLANAASVSNYVANLLLFFRKEASAMRTFYEEWNSVFEADAGQLSVADNLADASAKKN